MDSFNNAFTKSDLDLVLIALEIFLKIQIMLYNFIELLELWSPRYNSIDFRNLPFNKALDIFNTALTSLVCNGREHLMKEWRLFIINEPGFFKKFNLSESIIEKIESTVKYFKEMSSIESIQPQVKDALLILKELPKFVSKKLIILIYLLKATSRKAIDSVSLEDSTYDNVKLMLDIMNELIRDYKEKETRIEPRSGICTYCDNALKNESRFSETFCCKTAERLYSSWKQWLGCSSLNIPSLHIDPICDIKVEIDRAAEKNENLDKSKEKNELTSRGHEERREIFFKLKNYPSDISPVIAKGTIQGESMRELTGKGNVKSSAKESAKITRISKQRKKKFKSIRKQVSSHTRDESSSGNDKDGGNDSSEARIRGGADSVTEERSKDSSWRKKESPPRNVDEDGKGHKNRREMAKSRQEIDNKSGGDSTLTKKETKGGGGGGGGGDDAAIDEKLIMNDPSSERKRKKDRASRDQSPDSNLCGIRDRPPNSIEYQLSNPLYVELGWTVLPITRNRRKIVEYRTVPAKPHLNRLKMLECEITEYYDGDGPRPFLDSHADGSAEIYYPNGKLAMKVYSAKERNYDMYTVFTPGGKDASSGIERESQITAIFDSLGNGVVFDEVGATRLSYNQFGGFSRDYPGRPPYSWPWAMQSSELTSETVYVEKSIAELEKLLDSATAKVTGRSSEPTEISRTSSPREKGEKSASKVPSKENREVVKETFDSPKVTRKAVSSFPIKPVCLKINDYFSLRILDRKNINLLFIAAKKKLKIELGTTIDLTQVRAEHYVDADEKSSFANRNRFQDMHLKSMESSGTLRHLIQEYKKLLQSSKERRIRVAKIRAFCKHN